MRIGTGKTGGHAMATAQRWPREDELELLGCVEDEASVVANAIRAGQRDENDLTNRLFAAHHPELANRRLSPGQIGFDNLRREWLRIRDTIVRPLVWSHIRSAARRIALRE